jgi:hypothetical protein
MSLWLAWFCDGKRTVILSWHRECSKARRMRNAILLS